MMLKWTLLISLIGWVCAENELDRPCEDYPALLCCYHYEVYAGCFSHCSSYVNAKCSKRWENRPKPTGAPVPTKQTEGVKKETQPPTEPPFEENPPQNCGTKEFEYKSCVPLEKANERFQQCCKQNIPEACLPSCKYSIHGDYPSRRRLFDTLKTGCPLTSIQGILYCASNKRDNRDCCSYLNLDHEALLMEDRCLRFCDPGGQGVGTLVREDYKCLRLWQRIMMCHLSGLRELS